MGIGDELDGAGVSYFVVGGLCWFGYETKIAFEIMSLKWGLQSEYKEFAIGFR